MSAIDRETLAGLADALIPEADGMPSATQAGAAGALLDEVLAVRGDLEEPLAELTAAARGADPAADPEIYQRLEAEAARMPPGADGVLLLPYWSGTMAPFWDPDAGGAVVGLRTGHGRGHYWRAMLEGVALDCAMG